MLPDVSLEIRLSHTAPLTVKTFGVIVSVIKDGVSVYGVEGYTSLNVSGEPLIAVEILQSQKSSCILKVPSQFDRSDIGAMEIQFKKPSLRYQPGQWIFINVPEVSPWQWHPFTITSCPADPFVSIHIRQVGDFTKALGSVLGSQAVNVGGDALLNGRNMPVLRVDGPFGAPAEDVLENEIAVLIGAGIGVTPWASVLKHILSQFKTAHPPQRLRRVEFIWFVLSISSSDGRIVPSIESFEWFKNLLASLEQEVITTPHDEKNDEPFLRVHNYLTAKLDASTVQNIMINDSGAMSDALTGLRSRTLYGRPNWQAIFSGMREGIERGTYIRGLAGTQSKVGVYFCGPSALAKTLKKECKENSSEFVKCRDPLLL